MSPRRGGEADKIGNRYEGAWTVARLLHVLAGRLGWVKVEPLGDLGRGAEFVLGRFDGCEEAHQVKRQFGDANEWNVGALTRLGVWDAARRHVDSGRDYHFVSTVPFRPLQELADRTRSSDDLTSFLRAGLPQVLDALFSQVAEVYGGTSDANRVLRRFHVRLVDESDLRHTNEIKVEWLLEGRSGSQASASLGELVDDHIDTVLTAEQFVRALRPYRLSPRSVVSRRSLVDRVAALTDAWVERTGRELLHPVIERDEAAQLQSIPSAPKRFHFLVGAAGGGKTAVLHQAVIALRADGIPTLRCAG